MLAVVVADVEGEGEYQFERRQFGTTLDHLRLLSEWFVEREVEDVVMESPVPPNSLWHDERAVRDKFRIHYADLDPAVGSTRLFAIARNARVGFAKTLGAHDCRGNSGLHQEVADSFGATL
jgi:hypothetical protein